MCFIAFGKRECSRIRAGSGSQLQQALVDRAQLLGFHVAPVHACERLALRPQPSQPPNRRQKAAVLDPGVFEVWHNPMGKQAAEGRQAKLLLATHQRPERGLQALP